MLDALIAACEVALSATLFTFNEKHYLVVPGLVTKGKSRRLAVLRRVIGLGCDPAYRYAWRREEATGVLMAQLAEKQLPSSPEALIDRVSSMDRAQLELVFTTAWYQGWKALREAAWARLATLA